MDLRHRSRPRFAFINAIANFWEGEAPAELAGRSFRKLSRSFARPENYFSNAIWPSGLTYIELKPLNDLIDLIPVLVLDVRVKLGQDLVDFLQLRSEHVGGDF